MDRRLSYADSRTCPAHDRDSISLTFMVQALLVRHESFVAEAAQERRRMMDKIEALERTNTALEDRNRDTIRENRMLLDQLESLNSAVKGSESRVNTLTDELQSTDLELKRMTNLASRTAELQTQLVQLEEDLAAVNSASSFDREENRVAKLRWQQAEKTIETLELQIERIESDAKEERERHADVGRQAVAMARLTVQIVNRVQRRKAIELELLRDRPWKDRSRDIVQNGVVSNFVTDVLQDNANLQVNILELREMLGRSNDEIERLRDPTPMSPILSLPKALATSNAPSLGMELNGSREVHVHHHYHATQNTDKAPQSHYRRRSRRKGSVVSVAHTPHSSVSVPRAQSPSSVAGPSQPAASIPIRQRWSVQSAQTFTSSSSLPSSPYADSIFDRTFADTGTEASRPSSPDSNPMSPQNALGPTKVDLRPAVPAFPSEPRRNHPDGPRLPLTSYPLEPGPVHSTILEENEDIHHETPSPAQSRRLPLRRPASSESLLSIHGMDIHTTIPTLVQPLRNRPSQWLLRHRAEAVAASDAATVAIAAPLAYHADQQSTAQLRLRNQMDRRGGTGQGLGVLLGGGWVWGRWSAAGAGAAPATGDDASSTASSLSAAASSQRPVKPMLRPPGVNQSGPILGFLPETEAPPGRRRQRSVVVRELDVAALRACLENG
jgi:hypothetical protein